MRVTDNNRLLKTQNGKDFIKALSVLAKTSCTKDWDRQKNLHFFALKGTVIEKTERYKKKERLETELQEKEGECFDLTAQAVELDSA